MNLTTEAKQQLFKKYGEKDTNTGSTEGQVALFTARINHNKTLENKSKRLQY